MLQGRPGAPSRPDRRPGIPGNCYLEAQRGMACPGEGMQAAERCHTTRVHGQDRCAEGTGVLGGEGGGRTGAVEGRHRWVVRAEGRDGLRRRS